MKIKITKLSEKEITQRNIPAWPIWKCDISCFDWTYDATEECLLLEGEVVVETATETVTFGAGDFVTFPAGLSCVWDVKQPVRKHYNFL